MCISQHASPQGLGIARIAPAGLSALHMGLMGRVGLHQAPRQLRAASAAIQVGIAAGRCPRDGSALEAASGVVGKRQQGLLGRIKEELWAELGNDFTLTESS